MEFMRRKKKGQVIALGFRVWKFLSHLTPLLMPTSPEGFLFQRPSNEATPQALLWGHPPLGLTTKKVIQYEK